MVLCNVNEYVGFGSQQTKVAPDTMDVHATAPIQATRASQMPSSSSPGTGMTGMPCLAASAMRRPPGSLMQGMPASETTATLAPPKSCSRTCPYPQRIYMSHFREEAACRGRRMCSPPAPAPHLIQLAALIVLVQALQGAADVQGVAEARCVPRVLAVDSVHRSKHAQGSRGEVLQVANGRAHHVQAAPSNELCFFAGYIRA